MSVVKDVFTGMGHALNPFEWGKLPGDISQTFGDLTGQGGGAGDVSTAPPISEAELAKNREGEAELEKQLEEFRKTFNDDYKNATGQDPYSAYSSFDGATVGKV